MLFLRKLLFKIGARKQKLVQISFFNEVTIITKHVNTVLGQTKIMLQCYIIYYVLVRLQNNMIFYIP